MKIRELTNYLESLAPLRSQESYDNSGLIVGDPDAEITQALISLDCLESTVDEAIDKGCQIVIAHHPIVFKGLKKFNGSDYVERTVIKAIKNDIALYAIHTNLDNYRFGVNAEIGERLGLLNLKILAPKKEVLTKLVTYVPADYVDGVREAMFMAGAGAIGNYSSCSYSAIGIGTFEPMEGSEPFSGKVGARTTEEEVRLEVLVPTHILPKVIAEMKDAHPFEEVAYDAYTLLNENPYEGAGMIGTLAEPMDEIAFLEVLKKTFACGIIRHTALRGKKISKVSFCGGAGSFLLGAARREKADIYITGDFKYHEFFDAEDAILVADIGHYESEQFTSHLLSRILTKKFPKFALQLTEINTNPIKYF